MKLRNLHFLLLVLSATSLLFAYFVEYIMHLSACPLCIYQRFPYLVFIFLSIISLYSEKNYVNYYTLTSVCAIILAGYHTGVERGIFELSSMCKPLVSVHNDISIMDFTNMIYNQPMATCNKPALVIANLSMTEWNLVLNSLLLVLFIIFRKHKNIA